MSETPKAPAPTDNEQLMTKLNQLIMMQRRTEAATLAAALLSTRRKSLSIAEMLDVVRDIDFARNPAPNNPQYQEWELTKAERLSRIYK